MPIFSDIRKSPADANVAKACDWAPLLPRNAVLASSSFAIDTAQPAADGALELADGGFTGTTAIVLISAGTRGLGSRVVNTVTYVDDTNRTVTLQRGFYVLVRDNF